MAKQNVVFIDNRPNQIPDELKAKMKKLEEGQVVRIKLNRLKFGIHKMALYTSENPEKPKVNPSMVEVAGNIGIAARWEFVWDNKRIPCGFYTETDAQGEPAFKPLKFNRGADKFLYGGNPEHEQIYELLQVHPQYRNRVNGPASKMWICELDIPESASMSDIEKFNARNKVESRISSLNQDELNILMSNARYEMGFLSRPDAIDNSTLARGIVISESAKTGGIQRVAVLLENMDRVKEILQLHDIFSNQKFTLVGNKLFDEKGGEIHTFTDSFKGNNAEEQAIWLHPKMLKVPAVKEAAEAIKAYKKK
jgi:hypothetical protein